jgi:peptidyl-prolyl cis-trans isomerase C
MMTYSQVSFAGAASRALAVMLAFTPLCGSAWSQGAPAAPAANAAAASEAPADPIVAKVAGQPIRLAEVREAMASLPANAQSMPPQSLFPILLDQIIDSRILVREARTAGLDKDPVVQRQILAAADRVLQAALLHRAIDPLVTDAALHARFDRDLAGKTGEEEVHARHILVPDEPTAKKITADLKKGGDFAALSKQYSKDPGASQQGGDLGFFKKTDMVPEFANAAFALKDGEVTASPVQTQFGWHVIQVIERRHAPPPAFEDAREDLRQKIVQETVASAVASARKGVAIEKFNMDGSAPKATDTAEPPPAK